jgi:hypothetical protein
MSEFHGKLHDEIQMRCFKGINHVIGNNSLDRLCDVSNPESIPVVYVALKPRPLMLPSDLILMNIWLENERINDGFGSALPHARNNNDVLKSEPS